MVAYTDNDYSIITWSSNSFYPKFCVSTIYLHDILMNGKRAKYLRKLAIKTGKPYKLLKKAWILYQANSLFVAVNK